MGAIRTSANATFRDYVVDGVPASGPHEPVNSDIRNTFGVVETVVEAIEAGQGAGGVVFMTKAAMDAVLTYDANTKAEVYADPTPANNGVYQKQGASGAGSWTRISDLAVTGLGVRVTAVEGAIEAMEPDGSRNYFAGGAGPGSLTGVDDVAAGVSAAAFLTTGSRNTDLGRAAGRSNTTGGSNVNIGAAAGVSVPSGDQNTRVGADAQASSSTATSGVTAVGYGALVKNQAADATGVGRLVGQALTTGVRFTAMGVSAGSLQSTQTDGTFFGWGAGNNVAHVPGNNQTALGADSYCDQPDQVTLGNNDVTSLRLFGSVYIREGQFGDTFIGKGAGNDVALGGTRTFFGFEAGAGCNTAADADAVAIGYAACGSASQIRASVVIGTKACQFAFNTIDCTVVGDMAGMNLGRLEPFAYVLASDETKLLFAGPISDPGDTLPVPGLVGATFFGKNAGRYNTIGVNNSGFGDSALGFTTKGSGNTAVGYVCLEGNVKGNRNTGIGTGARCFMFSGDDNTVGGFALGNGIGIFSAPVAGGSRNTNFGTEAVYVWTGSDTASLGYRAFFNMTGGDGGDVGIGAHAGHAVITGGGNIFIGQDAGFGGSQATDVQNSIVIGAGAVSTADNQMVLGNSGIIETIIHGAIHDAAFSGIQKNATFLVDALPSAATAGAGARAFVTDATATTFASIVTGGGADGVPVYSDGTDWRIG